MPCLYNAYRPSEELITWQTFGDHYIKTTWLSAGIMLTNNSEIIKQYHNITKHAYDSKRDIFIYYIFCYQNYIALNGHLITIRAACAHL